MNPEKIDIDSYEKTDHPRVWWKGVDRVRKLAIREAAKVVDEFPGLTIFASAGPYRSYDVEYGWIDFDERYVYLDYYSVRPGTGHTDEIVRDIRDDLDERRDTFEPDDESETEP